MDICSCDMEFPLSLGHQAYLAEAAVLAHNATMEQMKKTPVRELDRHRSELAREAAGSSIGVIAVQKAPIFASMRKIWARMPQVGDSTKILEEDRNR